MSDELDEARAALAAERAKVAWLWEAAQRAWQEWNSTEEIDQGETFGSRMEQLGRALAATAADAPRVILASEVVAWLKAKPGCSYVATLTDVEACIDDLLVKALPPAPEPRKEDRS